MATSTSNYKLVKPSATDLYDVSVFNSNMDLVDAALKAIRDGSASTTLSNLSAPSTATGNLLYRGTIDANNLKNANDCTNIGVYKIYLNTSVTPSEYNFPGRYGMLLIVASMDATDYDYVSQIYYSITDKLTYIRTSSNNGGTWSNWVRYATHDEVTGITATSLGAVKTESTLNSSTDLNTVTTSGMYRINESPANAPGDASYSQLLVVHGGRDTIAQLLFSYSKSRMYLRTGNPTNVGGTGKWNDWVEIVTSGGTLTSGLTLPEVVVASTNNSPQVKFRGNGQTTSAGIVGSNTDTRRTYFLNNCADTSYYETFHTPAPDTGRKANGSYELLTTKSPVAIEQGGHGGKTAAEGRVNMGIQSGVVSSIVNKGNSTNQHSITFETPYSNVPTVVVGAINTSNAQSVGEILVSANDITKTGFTIKLHNAGSSDRTLGVSWIAVGS